MTHLLKILCALMLGVHLSASASCLNVPRLTGVNLAGAEFNSKALPGVVNKDYTYPSISELAYIAEQGANVIRLPFRWERIQHEKFSPLNSAELKRLRDTVNAANAHGLCVILDVHNYAKYHGEELDGNSELHTALVDVWLRLAREFKDPAATAFGLMNEPAYMPIPEWATLAKRILSELRKEGARNMVLIAGGHWSGLHDWFVVRNGQSNATAFADVRDPLARTVLEVHQYADEHYSGSKTECHPPDHFSSRFTRITDWARDNNQQLFLGEFGMPQNELCLETMEHFLTLMQGDVWKGWTYWAAGRWWGNYPLAVSTNVNTVSPQWNIMKNYFYPDKPDTKSEPGPPRKLSE